MTIDTSLFTDLGINLSGKEGEAFLKHFEETLEQRVGAAIFELLSDDEATELIRLQESGDSEQINGWIKEHIPDYEEVVQDEFDILMAEVAENAEALAVA